MNGPGPLVVLAAGGTGGHLFPAEALAAELLGRGLAVALVTDRRGRGFGDRLPAVAVHRISAGGLAGGSLIRRAEGALRLAIGLFQARGLLARLAPRIVVGFGGYPSVPTMLAAARAGLPTVLHEQNALLGRANRLLAAKASRIATSFPTLQGAEALDTRRVVFTGNPVRAAIAAVAQIPYRSIEPGGPIRLLVLGGSQGARVFGRVLPAAFALLSDDLRRRLVVTQQCRPEDIEATRDAYGRLALRHELATFFENVPELLAAAHLVIARAGASTVAELAAAGRPALLVPYPFAADDHQTANARAASEMGGAWLLPERVLTPGALAERLHSLVAQPGTLATAAACARAAGRRDAAARLADLVTATMPGNGLPAEAGQRREAAA